MRVKFNQYKIILKELKKNCAKIVKKILKYNLIKK